jgi:hypothetical protein
MSLRRAAVDVRWPSMSALKAAVRPCPLHVNLTLNTGHYSWPSLRRLSARSGLERSSDIYIGSPAFM